VCCIIIIRAIQAFTLAVAATPEHLTVQSGLPDCVQDTSSGSAGATTTSDYISDVVDWKVGAASLAVAIVLWYIFA
jgi:hypothetical protein